MEDASEDRTEETTSSQAQFESALFERLTSSLVSRNKYYTKFTNDGFRAVHRRYRVVSSLKKEAGKLAIDTNSVCWITSDGNDIVFHMESPQLFYKRAVALKHHEWEWLLQQQEVRQLLKESSLNTRSLQQSTGNFDNRKSNG